MDMYQAQQCYRFHCNVSQGSGRPNFVFVPCTYRQLTSKVKTLWSQMARANQELIIQASKPDDDKPSASSKSTPGMPQSAHKLQQLLANSTDSDVAPDDPPEEAYPLLEYLVSNSE